MPKLCGTASSFYGGGMVAGQPIGTMIGSRMINNAQAGFIIGAVIMLASDSWRLPSDLARISQRTWNAPR